MIDLKKIDRSWSLFLDRDGVINRRRVDDYVKTWDEFEFLPDVQNALKVFSDIFGKIIVITNQQGVGKGLMTEKELQFIHQKMVEEISKAGGRIDAVYYCTDLKTQPENCRKPSVKLYEQAVKDFPDIKTDKSIMIGDSESDMEFGKNAGMFTVFVGDDHRFADFHVKSLWEFARLLNPK
jgi:histidinol-phosphate phosphatase family protein